MKLEFRGWRRRVNLYSHDVIPLRGKGDGILYRQESKALVWDDGLTAFGKVENLSLAGNFLVAFRFTKEELKGWLQAYLVEDTESALKLIGEAQASAIEQLKELARTGSG